MSSSEIFQLLPLLPRFSCNHAVGQISHVECSFGGPGIPCDLPEEQLVAGLNWEMWCGPVEVIPPEDEKATSGCKFVYAICCHLMNPVK